MQQAQHILQKEQPPARVTSFYTVAEAARLLRVSPSTVWRWIARGQIRAYRVGEKTIRIEPGELETVIRPFASVRRGGGAMKKETEARTVIAPMSPGRAEDQSRVVEEARRLQQRILARRKGRLLPPSYIDIARAREERTASL